MKYEEVIKAVGGCGRYQLFILNLLYISTIYDGLQVGSMVFIVAAVKYRCAIPGLANDTYEIQSEAHAEFIKEYIPEEKVDGKPMYSNCHLYANKSVLGNQTLSNCTSWVYDKSIFQTTIITDFNLVCGKEWLTKHIYTVFFAGYLVAKLGCGWLSDRFGRKTVIIAALMLQGSAGILSSQINNIYVILILRFLTAVGGAGSFLPSIVFGAEISSVKNRTAASIAIQMYFTMGYLILTLLAYYIRNWALIVLLVSLPSIPSALLYICVSVVALVEWDDTNIWQILSSAFFYSLAKRYFSGVGVLLPRLSLLLLPISRVLPESPRWLLTVKKVKEAEIVLNKIAEVNKRDFNCKSEDIEISALEERTIKLWKIFTIPKLQKRTIIMIFNWCVVSYVYYGLMLNTENLSGNIFLNFFFGALVEIPAYLICIVLLNRIGRKKLYIVFIFMTGICGILTIFPSMYASEDLQWTTTSLVIFSKLCITATFGIIYLHSCELYPTCVRNAALGMLATFSRLGGFLTPYIMMIRTLAAGRLGDSLTLLMMGLICLLSGVSYYFLPETNNKPMQDTFDDVYKIKINSTREKDEHQLEAETALNSST